MADSGISRPASGPARARPPWWALGAVGAAFALLLALAASGAPAHAGGFPLAELLGHLRPLLPGAAGGAR